LRSIYAEWEITGPAELRAGGGGSFNPFRGPTMYVDHLPSNEESPVEDRAIDADLERFLVLLFPRRYLTWCARCRRFAQMERATDLHRQIAKDRYRV